MVTYMNDKKVQTLDNIRAFLEGTTEIEFSIDGCGGPPNLYASRSGRSILISLSLLYSWAEKSQELVFRHPRCFPDRNRRLSLFLGPPFSMVVRRQWVAREGGQALYENAPQLSGANGIADSDQADDVIDESAQGLLVGGFRRKLGPVRRSATITN